MASGDGMVLQLVLNWPSFLIKPTKTNKAFINTEGRETYPIIYTNNPYFIEHTKVINKKTPKKN